MKFLRFDETSSKLKIPEPLKLEHPKSQLLKKNSFDDQCPHYVAHAIFVLILVRCTLNLCQCFSGKHIQVIQHLLYAQGSYIIKSNRFCKGR